jgi:hypothetical protein
MLIVASMCHVRFKGQTKGVRTSDKPFKNVWDLEVESKVQMKGYGPTVNF